MCFILPVPPRGGRDISRGHKPDKSIRIVHPRQAYTCPTSSLPPYIVSSKTRIGTKPPITIKTEYLNPPSPLPDETRSPITQQAETEQSRYTLPNSLLDELIKDKLFPKSQSSAPTSPASDFKKEPANDDHYKKQDEKLDKLTATLNSFVADAKAKEEEAKYQAGLGKAMKEGIEKGWKKGQAHTIFEVEIDRKEKERDRRMALLTAAVENSNASTGFSHPHVSGGIIIPQSNTHTHTHSYSQSYNYNYNPPLLIASDPSPNMCCGFPSPGRMQTHTQARSTLDTAAHHLHRKLDEGFGSLESRIEELAEDGRMGQRDMRYEVRRGVGRLGGGLDRAGYGLDRVEYDLGRVEYGFERVERDLDDLSWGVHDIRGDVRGMRRRELLPSSPGFGRYGYLKPRF